MEFVVFKSPTPIMIREAVHFAKDIMADEKNASKESYVIVFRMQPRGGNMPKTGGWK